MGEERIAVIGAGSWGTALSIHLAKAGKRCALWGRDQGLVSQMAEVRENPKYLPGISIPSGVEFFTSLKDALEGAEVVLMVVPSHGYRHVFQDVCQAMDTTALGKAVFVSCAKGIEQGSLMFMTQVMEEVLGDKGLSTRFAVLSGPSFAKEVAQGLPTAVTAASRDEGVASFIQETLSFGSFRVYTSHDVLGVEVGGAVKNVLAVAVGISDGMGLGLNARAALITRGLAEIVRLGMAMGASPLTFAGLSGLGDLVLTCTGDLSRNRQVGLRLGRGETMESILSSMPMVAEGINTSKALHELAIRLRCDMPISQAVYQVLYEGVRPWYAVTALLERPLKAEWE